MILTSKLGCMCPVPERRLCGKIFSILSKEPRPKKWNVLPRFFDTTAEMICCWSLGVEPTRHRWMGLLWPAYRLEKIPTDSPKIHWLSSKGVTKSDSRCDSRSGYVTKHTEPKLNHPTVCSLEIKWCVSWVTMYLTSENGWPMSANPFWPLVARQRTLAVFN